MSEQSYICESICSIKLKYSILNKETSFQPKDYELFPQKRVSRYTFEEISLTFTWTDGVAWTP